mgnify:CR=1 FL=1
MAKYYPEGGFGPVCDVPLTDEEAAAQGRPARIPTDDELFYELNRQIDDLKLQLEMDVDAGWITQAEADERISDLREEVVEYKEQEESDCFRTGSLLIGAGAFIVISVPLAVIAVVRGRRKEKLGFSSSIPKQPKKNNDMFNDSDDFDNPIFS